MRRPARFTLVSILAVIGLASASMGVAAANEFPSRTVRIVAPFSAGGGLDRVNRLVADHLSKVWKQPVIVENHAGGNGLVAASTVANAAPDGYTWLIGTPTVSTIPAFVKNPGFDPAKDLQPVVLVASAPFVMVVPAELPVKTVKEFIAYAKARPGQLNYASSNGGVTLYFKHFERQTGVSMAVVPYRGDPAAVTGIAMNEAHLSFSSVAAVQGYIQAGKVRAIAVTTKERAPNMPDLPSIAESGVPDFDVFTWNGILVPVGTPADIRDKIAKDVAAFLTLPEAKRQFGQINYIPRGESSDAFAALWKSESTRWTEVAADAGITPK